ncbi:MAG: 50S ribosomal protein L17 [Bacteroidota bacterium]
MRHGKKFNHLGRKTAHRGAMLSNMASSLIMHKRINTTVAKAKALRKYIEPLLTKSKTDNTHSRRMVFSYLQNKESVTELFNNVADKIANRPGGYTRIIKVGTRLGDNAEMCMMELVDFNELLIKEESIEKTKTRRSRRGRKSKAKADTDVPVIEESMEEVQTTEVTEEETSEIEANELKTDTDVPVIEESIEKVQTIEVTEETSEIEANEPKVDAEEAPEAVTKTKEETIIEEKATPEEEGKKEDNAAESGEKKD